MWRSVNLLWSRWAVQERALFHRVGWKYGSDRLGRAPLAPPTPLRIDRLLVSLQQPVLADKVATAVELQLILSQQGQWRCLL